MKKSGSPSLHGLDVRTLRLFEAVAFTGSLTQAAKANHLAVGAASRRISNFESMIGKPLLDRNSRGLRLTPAGRLIADHVTKILDPLNAMSLASLILRTGVKGHARIVANSAAIAQHLPETVARFRKVESSILVEIEEVLSSRIAQAVQQQQANIGIMNSTAPKLGLAHFPYRSERMLLVMPAGHPLSRHERVRFEETLDYEYVGLTPTSSIFRLLTEKARNSGKMIRTHAQVGGLDNACRMVGAGLGMTVCPEGLARTLKKSFNLRLAMLEGDDYEFNQIVVHNSEEKLTDSEKKLLEHLRKDSDCKNRSARGKTRRK